MQIIPVIDLSNGRVVHAVAGEREHYCPIRSQLCPGSNPIHIVQAFMELYPFRTIYIADLDAIAGKPANVETVQKLLAAFPDVTIWLDQGLTCIKDLSKTQLQNVTNIIGSETNIGLRHLSALKNIHPQPVLSLDFRGKHFLGNPVILDNPLLWPNRIIYMNLSAVGTESGVNEIQLKRLIVAAGTRQLFCAGGVRNQSELCKLNNFGVAGALLATALHKKNIAAPELKFLEMISAKKMPR